MSMRKDPIAAELGRRGGQKGGRARALSLTPEQRREIAQRAAAARWQRSAEDQDTPQPSLANTPMVQARGSLPLDGQMLDAFVLEDGRRLIGLLSTALALGDTAEQLGQRVLDATGEPAVTFHVPGDWRLVRGIEPTALVAVCQALAGGTLPRRPEQGRRDRALRAIGLLAAFAGEGLAAAVDAAASPVSTIVPR